MQLHITLSKFVKQLIINNLKRKVMIQFNETTSGTTEGTLWTSPEFIKARDTGNSIELIYKQQLMISNLGQFSTQKSERVFKIVYSCVDGKWNKSEPVYGIIIPASAEYYEFED